MENFDVLLFFSSSSILLDRINSFKEYKENDILKHYHDKIIKNMTMFNLDINTINESLHKMKEIRKGLIQIAVESEKGEKDRQIDVYRKYIYNKYKEVELNKYEGKTNKIKLVFMEICLRGLFVILGGNITTYSHRLIITDFCKCYENYMMGTSEYDNLISVYSDIEIFTFKTSLKDDIKYLNIDIVINSLNKIIYIGNFICRILNKKIKKEQEKHNRYDEEDYFDWINDINTILNKLDTVITDNKDKIFKHIKIVNTALEKFNINVTITNKNKSHTNEIETLNINPVKFLAIYDFQLDEIQDNIDFISSMYYIIEYLETKSIYKPHKYELVCSDLYKLK